MSPITRCKCVVIGSATVGKTSLVKVILGHPQTFPKKYIMTPGVEISSKMIKVPSKEHNVELFIYDFSGKPIYKELVRKLWQQNVSLIVAVFDITREDSFFQLQAELVELLKAFKNPDEVSAILIGNKGDQREVRTVTTDDAHQLAKRFKMRYFEVSARDGRSEVEEAFTYLATSWFEANSSKI
ncbi:Intraflagellar transport protein 27 [Halotydeus destructor]|nr:Intraflagellar transport protein 27 [Halotydeus destructor]